MHVCARVRLAPKLNLQTALPSLANGRRGKAAFLLAETLEQKCLACLHRKSVLILCFLRLLAWHALRHTRYPCAGLDIPPFASFGSNELVVRQPSRFLCSSRQGHTRRSFSFPPHHACTHHHVLRHHQHTHSARHVQALAPSRGSLPWCGGRSCRPLPFLPPRPAPCPSD